MYKVNFLAHNWLLMKNANDKFSEALRRFKGVVYDLGCGPRPHEHDVLRVADKYVGVDWEHTLHGWHADVAADLNEPLPMADEVADTIMSLSVLEHLREPQNMLDEAYRLLRPGGMIFIAVPFQWWVHEAPYDYFRFTRYGLEYMLTKAGFTEIDVRENSGFWLMWVAKFNCQTLKLIRGPRVVQWIIRACLFPIWLGDQLLALLLDRHWHAPGETQGYNVTAFKR